MLERLEVKTMLQAILATEYERAIIDKLRNDDIFCWRAIVSNILNLPYTPEALEFVLLTEEHSGEKFGESVAEIERKKKKDKQIQKDRINKYHAEGYKGEPEFGKGAVVTFLKMI